MSASHNGSPDQPATQMVSQFQQLTPLGTTSGNWLNELKGLGYMPAGQTSWGNIGQTTMVPQAMPPSVDSSQTGIGGSDPVLIGMLQQRYGNKH